MLMTGSKTNNCSIIFFEKIDIKNIPDNLDIDLQLNNDQITGHINVTKSKIDTIINITNLRKKNFNLNLNEIVKSRDLFHVFGIWDPFHVKLFLWAKLNKKKMAVLSILINIIY